jgi:replication initiation protein RepC
MALLRERITLARRDIVKMIETGMEEGVPGDWEARHRDYQALASRQARKMTRADLEALAGELAALAAEINSALENHVKRQNKSANESQTERHIQNQNTNISDLEPSLRKGGAEPLGPNGDDVAADGARTSEPEKLRGETYARPTPTPRTYPLGMVLQACPDIVDYARGGEISSWRDLATTAATVRSALGVSPDAWAQALDALGEHDAAIVIAAILQRGEEIRSAGGYLRVLTAKARAGEFSLGPVLMALLRGKAVKGARERTRAG